MYIPKKIKQNWLFVSFFSILILCLGMNSGCKTKLNLDVKILELKKGWQFSKKGDENLYTAKVPGDIHSDLIDHKLIPDPFYRNNEKEIQWIEKEEWEYSTHFSLDEQFLGKKNIEMVFKGLDTYALVYLNNSLILKANNMFREWVVDVKPILQRGENTLLIHFLSPVKESLILWNQSGYELPGGPKVMTRKPGYHFGWDWGPRLVTSGIWKPVYIRAWNQIRIESLHILQKKVSKERACLSAHFEIYSHDHEEVRISLEHMTGQKILGESVINLTPGLNRCVLNVEIQNPRLWWTNNLGESYLYSLKGRVATHQGLMDEYTQKIGIRTLDLVTKEDEKGESFYFKLNGIPIFAKGANLVPLDSMVGQIPDRRYRSLINSTVAANMNMLRVWGGGLYEKDIFYDLCDEKGILVWQDFMFACAMYPADEDFLENVKQEAIINVKRLRHHPSIALWCGNNEISEAWHNWGWQNNKTYTPERKEKIWQDYQKLFHELLPRVVKDYDQERPYWPSSPKFGRGNPKSLIEGDSHYWGVWHDGQSFEKFIENTPRFMSEFGFQSFPPLETIENFSLPKDRDINSQVMLNRQKHPRGNSLIKSYMQKSYPVPDRFDLFVYVNQLLQADGLKMGIEAHRRARPYCMGSLYWQLNDCWPAVSWSSIDYYGRWKALHYFVKKVFKDILISTTIEKGNLSVYVISDRLQPVQGVLQVKLRDLSGIILKKFSLDSLVGPNKSNLTWQTNLQELMKDYNKRNLVLDVKLFKGLKKIASNLLYFVPPKDLLLKPPDIKSIITQREGDKVSITLSCESLAKNIYLSSQGVNGNFSDNFFDLLPGEPVEILFTCRGSIGNFEQRLKIISLFDTL
jgi:beta-mannosidase